MHGKVIYISTCTGVTSYMVSNIVVARERLMIADNRRPLVQDHMFDTPHRD